MSDRTKNIIGYIGIILLLWFFIHVILNGSTAMQRIEDRCEERGGSLNRSNICIIQPK